MRVAATMNARIDPSNGAGTFQARRRSLVLIFATLLLCSLPGCCSISQKFKPHRRGVESAYR